MLPVLPIALFASLAASVHGLPAEQIAQEKTSMTGYTEANWSGNSKTWSLESESKCYRLGGTEWNDVISSVKVPDGHRCRLWSSNNCNGDSSPDIHAPGAKQLSGGMNNRATSFKCYQN